MTIDSCMPVIPCSDLEKSLRFWVEGLGLMMDREIRTDGRLIGCMVYNGQTSFWLNERSGTPVSPENYEGIRLYWAPSNIQEARDRLKGMGFEVSDLVNRDYGQTEFFVTG